MSQTLAIFHEAYRGLRARKMFWIILFLSLFMVVAFASIGINRAGLTILFWQLPGGGPTSADVSPAMLYKMLFVSFGIDIWLTWIAAVLALISTAGIFPNFIAKGAIDLVLARPISRLRLFLTQYAAALLFVTLQISVFSVAAFLVLGVRSGAWEPGLLLAVPLVVCFFSYLFCVCTLLGVWTRSTLAALLLTLLFWFLVFGVHSTETVLMTVKKTAEHERQSLLAGDKDRFPAKAGESLGPAARRDVDPVAIREAEETIEQCDAIGGFIHPVKTVLPKTSETIDLLERVLIATADLPGGDDADPDRPGREVAREVVEEFRQRSPWWVVGTSLGFEAVVLALASWVFCRRDF